MTTTTKKLPSSEEKLILPHFITAVTGRREKKTGKVTIPKFEELPKVRGKFMNLELPGTGISFTCRFWKGNPLTFHLMDGVEYEIPRIVADHINENCCEKKMEWVSPDGIISTGKPIIQGGTSFQGLGNDFSKRVKNKRHRFMFQILGDA